MPYLLDSGSGFEWRKGLALWWVDARQRGMGAGQRHVLFDGVYGVGPPKASRGGWVCGRMVTGQSDLSIFQQEYQDIGGVLCPIIRMRQCEQ